MIKAIDKLGNPISKGARVKRYNDTYKQNILYTVDEVLDTNRINVTSDVFYVDEDNYKCGRTTRIVSKAAMSKQYIVFH